MVNHPNRSKKLITPAKMTLDKLRRLYSARWAREWPEPNDYLAELWNEARAAHRAELAQVPQPEVWETTLSLMRESHEFAPAA